MQDVKLKITEEDYERYNAMDEIDFYKEIEAGIPIAWACGYGWYGCRLRKVENEYYIIHKLGSSCD